MGTILLIIIIWVLRTVASISTSNLYFLSLAISSAPWSSLCHLYSLHLYSDVTIPLDSSILPRPRCRLFIFKICLTSNTHILLSSAKDIGLEVNINKIKYTITSRENPNGNGHLTTDEGNFEKMSEFKYLGAWIIENNEVEKEANINLI